jgi:hypothetical protein
MFIDRGVFRNKLSFFSITSDIKKTKAFYTEVTEQHTVVLPQTSSIRTTPRRLSSTIHALQHDRNGQRCTVSAADAAETLAAVFAAAFAAVLTLDRLFSSEMVCRLYGIGWLCNLPGNTSDRTIIGLTTSDNRQLSSRLRVRLSMFCGSGLQVLGHTDYHRGQRQDEGEETDCDLDRRKSRFDWCGSGRT